MLRDATPKDWRERVDPGSELIELAKRLGRPIEGVYQRRSQNCNAPATMKVPAVWNGSDWEIQLPEDFEGVVDFLCEVAWKLFDKIVRSEGKDNLSSDEQRKYFLDTYAECLQTTYGYRDQFVIPASHKGHTGM